MTMDAEKVRLRESLLAAKAANAMDASEVESALRDVEVLLHPGPARVLRAEFERLIRLAERHDYEAHHCIGVSGKLRAALAEFPK